MGTNSDDYTLMDFVDLDDRDVFSKARDFTAFLDDWRSKGTYSYHRVVTSASSGETTIRDPATRLDVPMVVMSSNNYLGLNTRKETIAAARNAIEKYGTGMCGSRFLSGTYDLMEELERELARFEHCEAAMVFTSGYQANVGTISALLRPKDIAFVDRLSHASILDGCHLAGCHCRTFKHNDMADLERLLASSENKYRGRMIISEGVFSMDGDLAPLREIVKLARRYQARVMVDEAHATGVLGATGRGSVEHFGLTEGVDIVLGTFSKTFAATGGFIAGPRAVIEYVRHYGRSYMFSASPVPAVAAAVLAGIHIIQAEPLLRKKLWDNIHYLHGALKGLGFDLFPDPPESAIVTILIGPDTKVRAISKRIYEAGLFMSSVAYPAVPRDHGKLRLSVSSSHTHEQLAQVVRTLGAIGQEFRVLRSHQGGKHEDPPYSAIAVG